MDKEIVIKMLLASQEENKKLHAIDKQDEEVRAREERLHKRIDELTSINMRVSESQIRMMDQLAEFQRHLKQMDDRNAEMLTDLKRQKDMNKMARK